MYKKSKSNPSLSWTWPSLLCSFYQNLVNKIFWMLPLVNYWYRSDQISNHINKLTRTKFWPIHSAEKNFSNKIRLRFDTNLSLFPQGGGDSSIVVICHFVQLARREGVIWIKHNVIIFTLLGTNSGHSSRSVLGRPTGNNVIGHYFQHSFLPSST